MATSPPSRRSVLQSIGAVAVSGLAGCSAAEQPADSTTRDTSTAGSTTTTTATTTATTPEQTSLSLGEQATVDSGRVSVQEARVQRSVVVYDVSHHTGVVAADDSLFLVASIATQADVSAGTVRGSMELVVDGDEQPPIDDVLPPGEETINVAFRLPIGLDARELALDWRDEDGVVASWSLPDRVRQQLGTPPEFEVRSFEVPESVPAFTEFDVTVTVRNTGSGDGTFRAELGLASRSDGDIVETEVEAGETGTIVEELLVQGEPGDVETTILDWGQGRIERPIEIADDGQ